MTAVKFEILPGPRFWMPLAVLFGALFLAPCSSHGQDRQWEQVMELGNMAHAVEDIYTAETHFRKALDVARRFPAQDLRRSTTQRNLAQVLALQGRHADADTLYRAAIGIALLSLDDTHPYVLSLKDELAQLKAAESGDEPPEVEPPPPEASLTQFLYRLEKWLAMNSSLHLGASLPLIGNLQQSNEQGFYYGLDFQIPLFALGPLSTAVRLGFNSINLPPKHSLDEPLKLEGPAAVLAPAVGPLILSFGAGYYNVYTVLPNWCYSGARVSRSGKSACAAEGPICSRCSSLVLPNSPNPS
ncbi:tetratricopeptide repeat protein [Candidatus Neomarinimicrobiota bacterium]